MRDLREAAFNGANEAPPDVAAGFLGRPARRARRSLHAILAQYRSNPQPKPAAQAGR
jgi:hypothetical protein